MNDIRKACVRAVFDEFDDHGDVSRPAVGEERGGATRTVRSATSSATSTSTWPASWTSSSTRSTRSCDT